MAQRSKAVNSRSQRGLNPVGVDSLKDSGRQALCFKVAQSVADFEGRRFLCEHEGIHGTDSYLDLEGIRQVTNAIATWGVDLFVPHAFNYDAALRQPFRQTGSTSPTGPISITTLIMCGVSAL